DGKVVVGVSVFLLAANGDVLAATTDTNGAYQFDHLLTGTYTLYLGTGATQTVTVNTLEDQIQVPDLQFSYLAVLAGHLLTSGGAPVTDGQVSLFQNGNLIGSTTPNSDGTFEFLLLQTGTFDLQATADGATFAPVTGIVVNSGDALLRDLTAGTGTIQV